MPPEVAAESIFSSEVVPAGINLPHVSVGAMALKTASVGPDPTAITVKDQEQEAMEILSNYSFSALDLGRTKNINVDKKYYDCIA